MCLHAADVSSWAALPTVLVTLYGADVKMQVATDLHSKV